MLSLLHNGMSRNVRQPNSSEVSMPSTTASLPCVTTSRACSADVTMRNQPLPGPPNILSMNACSS